MAIAKPLVATNPEWGRRRTASFGAGLRALGLMAICPRLVLVLQALIAQHPEATWSRKELPRFFDILSEIAAQSGTYQTHKAIAMWMLLQALLYRFLPGPVNEGQLTPAGHLLKYKTNGLLAWIITCALFWLAHFSGLIKASFIAENWASFLAALNTWGIIMTIGLYIQARVAPTHPKDRIFSGNFLYDLFMGIELNPYLRGLGDIKLFINGRTGMMAWSIINFSHAALQSEKHGSVTTSMLVVIALQMIYILDFFWNEHWYLQTIDVAHDHVGFYLAWGCMAWLPATYTLQAQFLARHPVELSPLAALAIFATGLAGYIIFRSANDQKYRVRKSKGQCYVSGRPASFITAHYKTSDGTDRTSLLLTNGWWGAARHVNYLGDLILSYAMCAVCGTQNISPWFYAIYMSILLGHRCYRDEVKCSNKYGKQWEVYCARVPARIIPYIF